MNEILIRKFTKKIMSYGIPKLMAKDIVETAYIAGKGTKIEMYINYAIELTYGIGFIKKAK